MIANFFSSCLRTRRYVWYTGQVDSSWNAVVVKSFQSDNDGGAAWGLSAPQSPSFLPTGPKPTEHQRCCGVIQTGRQRQWEQSSDPSQLSWSDDSLYLETASTLARFSLTSGDWFFPKHGCLLWTKFKQFTKLGLFIFPKTTNTISLRKSNYRTAKG